MRTFFLLFSLLVGFVAAEAVPLTLTLEGTIGKSPVVMELTIDGKALSGNYYYKSQGKSIPFKGAVTYGEIFELVYEKWGSNEIFKLKESGRATGVVQYTGTLKNEKNGQVLPVTLKPANTQGFTAKNSYVKTHKLSAYNYLRLAHVGLEKDTTVIINAAMKVEWYSDTIARMHSFRVISKANLRGVDSVNKFVNDLYFKELISYFDCVGPEYESYISSFYIKDHVLSFCLSKSYECGGADLDFDVAGFTFNLETGKQMELTDFLYFGKTAKDYPKGEDYKLGSEVMGPEIVGLLKKLYPYQMTKPKREDEICDYSEVDPWKSTYWYLVPEGLYLYPYLYRAAPDCNGADFSVIPYRVLNLYKNPQVVVPVIY